MRKILVPLALIFLLLASLYGCVPRVEEELTVLYTPESGHPPFNATIKAVVPEGNWVVEFEMPWGTEMPDNPGGYELNVLLGPDHVPCVIYVTATNLDTGRAIRRNVRINLENSAVNMDDRPYVASFGHIQGSLLPTGIKALLGNGYVYGDAWYSPFDMDSYIRVAVKHADPTGGHYITPLAYEVFFCERRVEEPLYSGYQSTNWGFYDPDGDDWHIVDVVIWYEYSDPEHGDAVFASVPYAGEGIYRVNGHENAFLYIGAWPTIKDENGRIKAPPGGVPGYTSVCHTYSCSVGPYPEQKLFVKITTEDVFGARRTKTFTYRLLPTGCW